MPYSNSSARHRQDEGRVADYRELLNARLLEERFSQLNLDLTNRDEWVEIDLDELP